MELLNGKNNPATASALHYEVGALVHVGTNQNPHLSRIPDPRFRGGYQRQVEGLQKSPAWRVQDECEAEKVFAQSHEV
jgi:hypothetical protein